MWNLRLSGTVTAGSIDGMVEPHARSHSHQRRRLRLLFALFAICIAATRMVYGQQPSTPEPRTGTLVGTVTDLGGAILAGATVVLKGPDPGDSRTVTSNDNGFFSFSNIKPGVPYHINVSAKGFTNWSSPEVTLKPGQYLELPPGKLQLAVVVTSVTAAATPEQIATQQVEIAEKQRVLGFIPNFYVVYDEHPVPLTPKLKFRLAARTMTDPITILGSAFVAAIDQAANYPHFGQGWDAYGQRFGASYANGVTDIMIGGAVLPSLLHQDPRYFYKGIGTNKSRTFYALASPFRTKGDNGRWQPNYSGLGGYLASGAIANTYYPESNRGPGLLFRIFGIDAAADMANGLIQEFLLRKLTPSAKNQH